MQTVQQPQTAVTGLITGVGVAGMGDREVGNYMYGIDLKRH